MVLFHTTSSHLEGDFLQPCTQVAGQTRPLLFASNNLRLSACYAVPNGLKHFCAVLDNDEVVIVIEKRALGLRSALDAQILVVPEHYFLPFGDVCEQFVSTQPVPMDEVIQHQRITSFDDLMRLGVRMFVPSPSANEFIDITIEHAQQPKELIKRLCTLGKLLPLTEDATAPAAAQRVSNRPPQSSPAR